MALTPELTGIFNHAFFRKFIGECVSIATILQCFLVKEYSLLKYFFVRVGNLDSMDKGFYWMTPGGWLKSLCMYLISKLDIKNFDQKL